MTPLLLAVRHAHPHLVLLLLSHEANQHYVTGSGQTMLHYAACAADTTIMNYLLQSKVKVNLQDVEGTTALIMACKMRQPAMVQQLLKHKAVAKTNPNLCDKLGRSPLHWAVEVGDVESARALIAAKADLNAVDGDMETPFVRAIKKNNLEVLDVLMDAGCDRADIDGLNGTATTIAALLGRTEVMERLLDAGEDPNEFGHFGFTPLTAAAFEGRVDTVKLLLDRGADPNFCSRSGSSPLMKAAVCVQEAHIEARHEVTRLLLRANADANQRVVMAGMSFTGCTNGRNCPMSFALVGGVVSLARMHLIGGCRVTHSEVTTNTQDMLYSNIIIRRYTVDFRYYDNAWLKEIYQYMQTIATTSINL
jgi:ankyrin repeat protein